MNCRLGPSALQGEWTIRPSFRYFFIAMRSGGGDGDVLHLVSVLGSGGAGGASHLAGGSISSRKSASSSSRISLPWEGTACKRGRGEANSAVRPRWTAAKSPGSPPRTAPLLTHRSTRKQARRARGSGFDSSLDNTDLHFVRLLPTRDQLFINWSTIFEFFIIINMPKTKILQVFVRVRD